MPDFRLNTINFSHYQSYQPVDQRRNLSADQSVWDQNVNPGKTIQNHHAHGNETLLPEADQKKLQQLKKRDTEVRQHEQAHLAAAGSLAQGGPSYEYESGPDGKRYAVGGEVSIDTSKVPNDPAATRDKARQIRRAALAPVQPSGKDHQVAAKAAQMELQAARELASASNNKPGSEKTPATFATQPISQYQQNQFGAINAVANTLDYYI